MITAFLHVVVDVVITCISATYGWSPAQISMTTQHKKHFMYIHRPTCFMSDMTLDIGLERK